MNKTIRIFCNDKDVTINLSQIASIVKEANNGYTFADYNYYVILKNGHTHTFIVSDSAADRYEMDDKFKEIREYLEEHGE